MCTKKTLFNCTEAVLATVSHWQRGEEKKKALESMSECFECACQHIQAWVSAGGRSGLGVKSHKNASLVTPPPQKNKNKNQTFLEQRHLYFIGKIKTSVDVLIAKCNRSLRFNFLPLAWILLINLVKKEPKQNASLAQATHKRSKGLKLRLSIPPEKNKEQ